MSDLRFEGRVVIVTGAGNGLGKSHALLFSSRGAKVVVNDLGGGRHGEGKSSAAADAVVAEIKKMGGEAVASYDSVEDGAKIVQTAMDTWGRVDVVVNNAGILRDTSFQKITQEDWDLIYRVHVLGAFRVTHAAWNVTGGMRDRGYGRVIFTTSAAGIYGNFGQSNYAMAKLGLVGLSNTLAIEGRKKNILVNAIAPIAGSRLTETVLPPDLIDALKPEYVSPLVAWLCHESCEETGGLFEVGGGFYAKLRWQRSEGKIFKLGRSITPEAIRSAWKDIASFDKVTYPADITSSMAPILGNLGTKSRGGNELIDVDEAIAADMPPVESSYDARDVALYALGIGAAENPLDPADLSLVYEMGDMKTFPTFAVIPAMKTIFDQAKRGEKWPGLNYGFERILHGEQYTELKRPLPTQARLKHKLKVKDIYDKGKNAVVVTSITTTDAETGEELAYNEVSAVVRGAGGWGGDRGPTGEANVPPNRAPDKVVTEKTHENQALLYRLSGDINPLHVDPGFAQAFGFQRPILHGLCTFGFAARAVVKSFAPNGDPRFFKSIKVRFSDSVFPGETLVTEMWKESDTKIIFQTKVKERDKVVISNAAVELYTEIPKPKPKAAPTASAEPISADIFNAIGAHFRAHADAIKKVGVVYQFKLTSPDSVWTIDTKNATVSQGQTAAPECTLELSDANFMAMCTGKADAQKLYFGGQLKISGNVMASQKLEFLRKLDPNLVIEAMKKRGAGAPAAAPAPATAPSGGITSAGVFAAIAAHVEKNAAELTKIGVVYLFRLTSPDSAWTVDLKAGKVSSGETAKAECTLELADSDFLDMAQGKADPQKLYFGGKLKISGNVMASQKLAEIFNKMKPQDVKNAMAAAAPAPATTPGPASAPREKNASNIFEALGRRLTENKSLGAELGSAVIQFNVDGKSWLVTAQGVREGTDAKASAVLTISDEHLTALVKGQRDARDLHQRGELRVDGDIRVAHKLGMLKGLV
jgi:3-hydroxyacyl-CoA dehydrogenase/3a,7a,12a-trihydroxy-5b-cholest-24-enoyl-CoA hydratase